MKKFDVNNASCWLSCFCVWLEMAGKSMVVCVVLDNHSATTRRFTNKVQPNQMISFAALELDDNVRSWNIYSMCDCVMAKCWWTCVPFYLEFQNKYVQKLCVSTMCVRVHVILCMRVCTCVFVSALCYYLIPNFVWTCWCQVVNSLPVHISNRKQEQILNTIIFIYIYTSIHVHSLSKDLCLENAFVSFAIVIISIQ